MRCGTYRGAATARGIAALRDYQRFLDAAGLPYQALDTDALSRRLGTRYYRFGLYSPDCSLAQPAALIRGLADCLPPSVSLHENTPALSLAREADGRWRIVCPAAGVRVAARNAWGADGAVCASHSRSCMGATLRVGADTEAGRCEDSALFRSEMCP